VHLAVGLKEIEVHEVVGLRFKHLPVRIAALCDMVWQSGHYDVRNEP
jgi:hypothetical protein